MNVPFLCTKYVGHGHVKNTCLEKGEDEELGEIHLIISLTSYWKETLKKVKEEKKAQVEKKYDK
jgi:hypothetical protein